MELTPDTRSEREDYYDGYVSIIKDDKYSEIISLRSEDNFSLDESNSLRKSVLHELKRRKVTMNIPEIDETKLFEMSLRADNRISKIALKLYIEEWISFFLAALAITMCVVYFENKPHSNYVAQSALVLCSVANTLFSSYLTSHQLLSPILPASPNSTALKRIIW